MKIAIYSRVSKNDDSQDMKSDHTLVTFPELNEIDVYHKKCSELYDTCDCSETLENEQT